MMKTIAMLAYLTCSVLTYGYYYNTHIWDNSRRTTISEAGVAGVFWPLYWLTYPVSYVFDLGICATRSFHPEPDSPIIDPNEGCWWR